MRPTSGDHPAFRVPGEAAGFRPDCAFQLFAPPSCARLVLLSRILPSIPKLPLKVRKWYITRAKCCVREKLPTIYGVLLLDPGAISPLQ